ncbi:MAG: hypothetical protein IIA83_10750 [Thaumarchaeota archaeon]|nr:hypothetical protein [Nitrososphaerota archaeon]
MMRIIFSIIIIIIAGGIAWYSFTNLQQAEEVKEISKPIFQDNVILAIEGCENLNANQEVCKRMLKTMLDGCSYYGNPPACQDPRIDMIMAGNFEQLHEYGRQSKLDDHT